MQAAAASGRALSGRLLAAPLCRRRPSRAPMAAVAAQAQAQPPQAEQQQEAGLHCSAATKSLPDIDRLQLLVEGKLGVPREIMEAVS